MGAIFGYSGLDDSRLIGRMSRYLRHRALDGYKYYTNKNITLGQGIHKVGADFCACPITNEDENIVLLCDGRIFDPDKIRPALEIQGHRFKTEFSGEVVLHLYEEYGMNFLNTVNGDFAFCLYDSDKRQLILCSDSSGSKPIYYYQKGGHVVFASDIKPILEHDLVTKKLDSYALDLFLTYLLLPTENTLLENIKRVMPSTYVIFDKDSKKTVEYFEVREDIDHTKPEDYFVRKTRAELEGAIESRIVQNIPIHISLGGLDSSIVTGVLASKTGALNTYSLGYENECSQLDITSKIAEMHNTNHHEIYVDERNLDRYYVEALPYFNSPSVMDLGAIIISSIFFKIKGKRALFFNGEGGDPVFGGVKNEDMLRYKAYMSIPEPIRITINHFGKTFMRSVGVIEKLRNTVMARFKSCKTCDYAIFADELQSIERLYASLTPTFFFKSYKVRENSRGNNPKLLHIYSTYLSNKNFSFLNRLMKLNIEIKSYMDHMVRNELLAVSRGLINNCPFLDKRLIEFSFRVPVKYKFKKYANKVLLAKATRDLFPKGMIIKKQGFGHGSLMLFKTYFSTNRSTIRNLFEESDLLRFFNRAFLEEVLTSLNSKRFPRHRHMYNVAQVHTLFSLGLWYEHYFNDVRIRNFF